MESESGLLCLGGAICLSTDYKDPNTL